VVLTAIGGKLRKTFIATLLCVVVGAIVALLAGPAKAGWFILVAPFVGATAGVISGEVEG